MALGLCKKHLSKKHPLHEASIYHDAVYEIKDGRNLTDPEYQKLTNKQIVLAHAHSKEESSKLADIEFLRLMKEIISTKYSKKFFKKLYYKSLARIFYRITRVYGDMGGW